MVRVRLISSDSINFGLENFKSDYLDDLLQDFQDGEASINVPFMSHTVLGFLKDVNCQYQNVSVLELRKLLGLRNLDEDEGQSDHDETFNSNDDTDCDMEETQYLIKIELESSLDQINNDQSGLDQDEVNVSMVNFQNSQRENAVQDQVESASEVNLEREDNEGEDLLEANREAHVDVHEQEIANDFNETSRETTGGILNSNQSVPDLIENVSSLLEDDFQDNGVEPNISMSSDLQDETPSESDPASDEMPLNRKVIVRYVNQGEEIIEDILRAKGTGKKRKRGNK